MALPKNAKKSINVLGGLFEEEESREQITGSKINEQQQGRGEVEQTSMESQPAVEPSATVLSKSEEDEKEGECEPLTPNKSAPLVIQGEYAMVPISLSKELFSSQPMQETRAIRKQVLITGDLNLKCNMAIRKGQIRSFNDLVNKVLNYYFDVWDGKE